MRPTAVRLSDIGHERLEKLCHLRQWSQSDLFRYLLEQEWQKNGQAADEAWEARAAIARRLEEK